MWVEVTGGEKRLHLTSSLLHLHGGTCSLPRLQTGFIHTQPQYGDVLHAYVKCGTKTQSWDDT